jgi:hypothetical protein
MVNFFFLLANLGNIDNFLIVCEDIIPIKSFMGTLIIN